MKRFIDISKYSPAGLLEELSETVHNGKNDITCIDKEKRRMSFIHRMSFKDAVDAVYDEGDRFEFYYEETGNEEADEADESEKIL